jgi:hypothetical protein
VAFLLIEQYPKESEEQDFTRRALAQMIKTGENSDDKMVRTQLQAHHPRATLRLTQHTAHAPMTRHDTTRTTDVERDI